MARQKIYTRVRFYVNSIRTQKAQQVLLVPPITHNVAYRRTFFCTAGTIVDPLPLCPLHDDGVAQQPKPELVRSLTPPLLLLSLFSQTFHIVESTPRGSLSVPPRTIAYPTLTIVIININNSGSRTNTIEPAVTTPTTIWTIDDRV